MSYNDTIPEPTAPAGRAAPQLPIPSDATLRVMAEYFNHLQDVAAGRRGEDRKGEAAVLDHIGLNHWLDACRWSPGGLPNTGYLEKDTQRHKR